jgi:hypothetical protein
LSKLKRIPRDDRYDDIHDAVSILKVLTDGCGGPLSKEIVKGWNKDRDEPITDQALRAVNTIYSFGYRTRGFT